MKDFEIWRLRATTQPSQPTGETTRQLFVPTIEPIGELPYELAGLLPNREHSRDLMSLIEKLPVNRCGQCSVVGVFAADPFLDCQRLVDRLMAKGYNQVTNFPPAAGYGAEFLGILDNVASGRAQEQRNFNRLAARGLTVSPAVTTVDDLPAALSWSPQRLWVVPSFDMWQDTAIDANQLLGQCRMVADETDVPIVLSAGQTDISPKAAVGAGARGLLLEEVDGRGSV